MRIALTLVAVAASTVALAGCGGDNSTEAVTTTETAATAPATTTSTTPATTAPTTTPAAQAQVITAPAGRHGLVVGGLLRHRLG
jgi:hypothetical protein